MSDAPAIHRTRVHLTTLGCARNEVDSEELAARLEEGGFDLVDDPGDADAVLVNTCGFVEQAKKDSIDTLLEAADLKDAEHPRAVVAVGCLAERYGRDLAKALPEADAVLGFDAYPDIAERLRRIVAGERPESHAPRDRRRLLPVSPVERPRASAGVSVPGAGSRSGDLADLPAGVVPASGPRVLRRRLERGVWAPLKIASGCDRRCAFCAIPSFRGSYLSRDPGEIVAEAQWLVTQGVHEVLLVSENSSSYGKDLGDLRALERLLPRLGAVEGLDRVRVSYLQPAELRGTLIDVMTSTPHVEPYFDLSFQHASGPLLRRMRRFGDADSFLGLLDHIRALAPTAGVRSNFIVGFPGETDEDVAILHDFLGKARLDAIGVFAYSDEEGTEGADLPDHLPPEEIERRRAATVDLVTDLMDERALERVGEPVDVLLEERGNAGWVGRAAHQGPDVDGTTTVTGAGDEGWTPGMIVSAEVVAADGVDLVARVRAPAVSAG